MKRIRPSTRGEGSPVAILILLVISAFLFADHKYHLFFWNKTVSFGSSQKCLAGIPKLERKKSKTSDSNVALPKTGGFRFIRIDTEAEKMRPDAKKVFLAISMPFRNALSLRASPLLPLGTTVVDQAIQQAKEHILASPPPPCAWKWDEVRKLIEKHGAYLSVEDYGTVNPYDDAVSQSEGSSMFFKERLEKVKDLAKNDTDEIAASIVANATAVVFEKMMMQYSGYSIGMLEYAQLRCDLFAGAFTTLQTSMMHWNAFRFMHATSKDPIVEDMENVKALQKFDTGDGSTDWLEYVMARSQEKLEGRRGVRLLSANYLDLIFECEFPPMLSSEREGREFRPFDVDDPLINLFEREFVMYTPKGDGNGNKRM